MARAAGALPQLDTLAALGDAQVAVPGQTLAGWLMIGADGGAYRNQLDTQWKDGVEAATALQRGEVAAAAGLASELESVLRGDARFAIAPLPSPRAPRDGWAVGLAVKKDATDLAQALQAGINELASGRLRKMFESANVAGKRLEPRRVKDARPATAGLAPPAPATPRPRRGASASGSAARSGRSSENMPPLPGTTSMISCVCCQYSNCDPLM